MKDITTVVYIIIFILVVSVIGYYKTQVTYYKTQYESQIKIHSDYVSTQKAEYNKLNNEYKDLTIKFNNQIIKAEENAKIKQNIIDTTVANNTKLLDGLHKQISNSKSNMPSHTKETIIKYTDTYSDVFRECTGRLKDMAEKADGHTVDVNKLSESWPEYNE